MMTTVIPNSDTVYVGAKRRVRRGTCGWCERHNQKLTMTVYVLNGAYHAADVCDRCLNEFRNNLMRKVSENANA